MSTKEEQLQKLVGMSNELGNSSRDFAMLGEGNTSCKVDSKSFFVKSSGSNLKTMKGERFVEINFDKILKLLTADSMSNAEVIEYQKQSMVDTTSKLKPSVETLFHAVCLSYEENNFIAHTHPASVNCLTCSDGYPENLAGRMYPDEIVVLGVDSVFLPYIDPGVELAKEIKKGIDSYIEKHGSMPKVIYMQNHGMIALGKSETEAMNITLTADKAARIRIGALSTGSLNLLSPEIIDQVYNRPDEKHRQAQLNS